MNSKCGVQRQEMFTSDSDRGDVHTHQLYPSITNSVLEVNSGEHNVYTEVIFTLNNCIPQSTDSVLEVNSREHIHRNDFYTHRLYLPSSHSVPEVNNREHIHRNGANTYILYPQVLIAF